MNVEALLKKLSFNELSNINIGGEGSGRIPESYYERLIDKINNALLAVHTRFMLIEKELVLQSYDWKSVYTLSPEHAVSNTASNALKYIMDTPANPFTGDLIFITGVRNEIGEDLPMNDKEQYASVFTPQTNQLQLTHVGANQAFFVQYQAKHAPLFYNEDDLDLTLAQEIKIPVPLEDALRYHVASGIFTSMSGQNVTGKSQAMDAKYEDACLLIEEKNLLGVPEIATNVKLERRGFI